MHGISPGSTDAFRLQLLQRRLNNIPSSNMLINPSTARTEALMVYCLPSIRFQQRFVRALCNLCGTNSPNIYSTHTIKLNWAAIVIQSHFRSYKVRQGLLYTLRDQILFRRAAICIQRFVFY